MRLSGQSAATDAALISFNPWRPTLLQDYDPVSAFGVLSEKKCVSKRESISTVQEHAVASRARQATPFSQTTVECSFSEGQQQPLPYTPSAGND